MRICSIRHRGEAEVPLFGMSGNLPPVQLLCVGTVWIIATTDKPVVVLSFPLYEKTTAGRTFFGIV